MRIVKEPTLCAGVCAYLCGRAVFLTLLLNLNIFFFGALAVAIIYAPTTAHAQEGVDTGAESSSEKSPAAASSKKKNHTKKKHRRSKTRKKHASSTGSEKDSATGEQRTEQIAAQATDVKMDPKPHRAKILDAPPRTLPAYQGQTKIGVDFSKSETPETDATAEAPEQTSAKSIKLRSTETSTVQSAHLANGQKKDAQNSPVPDVSESDLEPGPVIVPTKITGIPINGPGGTTTPAPNDESGQRNTQRLELRGGYLASRESAFSPGLKNGGPQIGLGYTFEIVSPSPGSEAIPLEVRVALDLFGGQTSGQGFGLKLTDNQLTTLRAELAAFWPTDSWLRPYGVFGAGYASYDVHATLASSPGFPALREDFAKGGSALISPGLGLRLQLGTRFTFDVQAQELLLFGKTNVSQLGGLAALGLFGIGF